MPPAIVATIALVLLMLPAAASAQRISAVPRTPWGHPDLQGRWTNATLTTLERPAEFRDQEYFTAEEAAVYEKTALARLLAAANMTDEAKLSGEFQPGVWVEDRRLVPTRRTSLIIGPTGRIPPLTADADARRKQQAASGNQRDADNPEERGLAERCLWFQVGGPPLLPGIVYNSNYEIVQTPTHLVILAEMGASIRIIPLDGRPHLPSFLRQWQGDSRGRWDGDTLVVETVNFGKARLRGASEELTLVERFRRVDADTIMYEFTASDAATWTAPWTAEVPMRRMDDRLYEFACHEGNRGLANILSVARAAERDSR